MAIQRADFFTLHTFSAVDKFTNFNSSIPSSTDCRACSGPNSRLTAGKGSQPQVKRPILNWTVCQ